MTSHVVYYFVFLQQQLGYTQMSISYSVHERRNTTAVLLIRLIITSGWQKNFVFHYCFITQYKELQIEHIHTKPTCILHWSKCKMCIFLVTLTRRNFDILTSDEIKTMTTYICYNASDKSCGCVTPLNITLNKKGSPCHTLIII